MYVCIARLAEVYFGLVCLGTFGFFFLHKCICPVSDHRHEEPGR
jgi:hypothetical protein